MTTTTENVADKLAALAADQHDAERRHAALAEQAQAAQARARAIQAEATQLASTEPDQFDETGNPKPKTKAAKLADELQGLRNPVAPWTARLAGTEAEVRKARNAVHTFQRDHHRDLIAQREHDARQAVADIRAALEGVIAAADRYARVASEISDLLVPVSGLDGSDLPAADAVSNMARDARRALSTEIRPPLPRSIFPEGASPPRVSTPGGYISAANVRPEVAA